MKTSSVLRKYFDRMAIWKSSIKGNLLAWG
jgi:hypothetical protein